ncbi:BON domain-containing protein [Caballeronia sp. LZ034LL]|uniref:BON domain-containing protein n=1 Tax=Caballeronia sp. LZ034LL TaxID=3038567 RepID=UPI0028644BD6|nr:BON domain-containing protein [Caballeronia sp. LZ034LL]MDR5837304.1 BON domain-containing protein [Caballeronia sp. LZ034LL]
MRVRTVSMMLACACLLAPPALMAQTTDAPMNQGTNATNQKSADRALAKAVRRALGKTPGFDSSGVFVRARSGVVTLSGSVRSGDQIPVAADVARSVKGVTSVNNKLGLFHGGNG